ncbi:MAG: molybdenum cofactor biosynthesis protein MoaE [Gemmatimonadales bacterium]
MAHWLTERQIDAAALLAEVASPGCGGTALFLGTVRRSAEDGDVDGIEYSASPEMAEAEFDRLLAEAKARWPAARVALRHRTGFVRAGEASVAIAVACPHRAEAFEACRYLIEETKKRVPVWKKERLASGSERWVGAGAAHA